MTGLCDGHRAGAARGQPAITLRRGAVVMSNATRRARGRWSVAELGLHGFGGCHFLRENNLTLVRERHAQGRTERVARFIYEGILDRSGRFDGRSAGGNDGWIHGPS